MKQKPVHVKLGRKQTAPRNLAAKALGESRFRPKVEADPKTYRRKSKHPIDEVLKAEEQEKD